jgi:exonuclease SbcC
MRINKLEFYAFGPYPGKVNIDFRPINECQLFLITGPTGCGKTTIFDAISFALFSESSGSDRKTTGLRSHFCKTNEKTYVRLEFEINNKIYTITRYPQQEIINQRGNLTTVSSDATLVLPDNVIVDGVRKVDEEMTKILNLNASQFKNIVMLAQGEFRKMLFADSVEREEIFRAIFGTDHLKEFQDILQSMAKETSIKKDTICYDIEKICSNIQLKEAESHSPFSAIFINGGQDPFLDHLQKEIHDVRSEIKNNELQVKDLKSKMEALKNEKSEIEKNNCLLDELKAKEQELQSLKNKETSIEANKSLIILINKLPLTENLEQNYLNSLDELNELRRSQAEDEKALNLKKEELVDCKQSLENTQNEIIKFKKQCETARISFFKDNLKDYFEYDDLLNRQNNLYQQLKSLKKAYDDKKDHLKELQDKLDENIGLETKLTETITEKPEVIEKINDNQNQLTQLKNVLDSASKLGKINQDILKFNDKSATEASKYENMASELAQSELIYGRHLAGILAEGLALGSPCPVCGSLEHPHPAQLQDHDISKEKIDELKSRCSEQLKIYNSINADIKEQLGKRVILINQLNKDLTGLKIENKNTVDEKFIREIRDQISCVTGAIKDLILKRQSINIDELQIKDITHSVKTLRELIKSENSQLTDLTGKLAIIETSHQETSEKIESIRKTLPTDYENARKLKGMIDSCLKYQEDLDNDLNRIKTSMTELNVAIKDGALTFEKNAKALEGKLLLNDSLFSKVQLSIKDNFGNHESYQQCKAQKGNLEAISKRVEAYKEELTKVSTQIMDLKDKTKNQSYKDPMNINDQIEKGNLEEEEFNLKRDQLLLKLHNNEDGFSKLNVLYHHFIESQERCNLLSNLDNVARGNNEYRISFERYILASYFENILRSANIKLQEMTGMRYEFVKKEGKAKGRAQQGLDIDIFDNYSGRERDVKSLSGGELFKASLALALGLSDVIQQNTGGISINTLFIDEGFGSLDTESLDVALQTLTDIQSKGKIIGIISHVQEVKDRLPTKIIIGVSKEGSYIKDITL